MQKAGGQLAVLDVTWGWGPALLLQTTEAQVCLYVEGRGQGRSLEGLEEKGAR